MNKLDKIITDSIHPLLKSVGFRKKDRRCNRIRGKFIDVIQIQESTYRFKYCVNFTVNLGVFVPEFWEIIWGRSFSGFANEADCSIGNRLGDLLQGKPYGDSNDFWWAISNSDELNQADIDVVNEVVLGLKEHAVTYLESCDNYDNIINNLLKQKGSFGIYALSKIHLALAQWKAGCEVDAVHTLNNIKNNSWKEKADLARALILKK